jgi:hypoxanthine phosphoribosyltransferase
MTAFPAVYKTLFTKEQISKKVKELGAAISSDYADKPLTVLVILKGSFVFAADLIRTIDIPINVEFMGLRSYGNTMASSGVVEITLDLKHPIEREHILIVEDIVDTGLTLDYLIKNLSTRRPASIKLAALLHKPSKTIKKVHIDYMGFKIPDDFVVGYGMDFAGKYRNLPEIGIAKPHGIV